MLRETAWQEKRRKSEGAKGPSHRVLGLTGSTRRNPPDPANGGPQWHVGDLGQTQTRGYRMSLPQRGRTSEEPPSPSPPPHLIFQIQIRILLKLFLLGHYRQYSSFPLRTSFLLTFSLAFSE